MSNENSEVLNSHKFSITAGIRDRAGIKKQIHTFCFHNDIKYDLTEDKGILNSTSYYDFKVNDEQERKLKISLEGVKNPYEFKIDYNKSRKIVENFANILQDPKLPLKFGFSDRGVVSVAFLKDTKEDIKEALKILIYNNASDEDLKNEFQLAYVNLGFLIPEVDYNYLKDIGEKEGAMSKEDSEFARKKLEEIQAYVLESIENLEQEFLDYQTYVGFY